MMMVKVVNLGTFVLNSNNDFMVMALKVVNIGTFVLKSNNFMMMVAKVVNIVSEKQQQLHEDGKGCQLWNLCRKATTS